MYIKPIEKQLANCKHPNSRRMAALTKRSIKVDRRQKIKLASKIKLNMIAEKYLWFKNHLPDQNTPYSVQQIKDCIELYLKRFDEELEQIKLKHSIGQRKNRQHAAREDILKMTMAREREEYEGIGMEMPNVTDKEQFELIREWQGELRLVNKFQLKKFSIKSK